MDLLTTLTAISQAVGIAKEIKEIDRNVDEAEFKLKVADLVSSLADAKISLSEAQIQINELQKKISELEGRVSCPICHVGKIKVGDVKKWDGRTFERHHCYCDDEDCSYETKRVFNTDQLRYRG